MKRTRTTSLLIGGLLLAAAVARADDATPAPAPDAPASGQLAIPYAFYSELFGVAGAYVYARNGFPQKQSQFLVTGMVGTKGSGMIFLRAKDLLIPGSNRLFVDPIFSVGYFHDNKVFLNGNADFPNEQAGTNDSDSDNFIQGNGWDNFYRVTLRYLLPIGSGRDHVVPEYRLEDGLLASGATGGSSLNPLASGRTYVALRPFYRSLSVNSDTEDKSQKTNGLDAELFWDNRDFVTNPSRGQSVKLSWSRDFGKFSSSNSWTFLSGEVDQYFSLGESGAFRQRVIALDFWTGTSPTWEYLADGTIANRPPTFEGAYLGGLWRMRGYQFARFNDKAAIYYAAEYRMIPRWNPFTKMPWVQKHIGVDWVQIVPFAELGRVAPSWKLDTLHSSMKWDAGIGLRALAKGLLVRVDLAGSRDGMRVQMMVDSPFQF